MRMTTSRQFPLIDPHLAQVEAYWDALRGDRPAPLRSEIDPRGIENALEYAFVLERIAPGVARFRLAGMHLNDLMGMEVRGMPLTSFFSADDRGKLGEALEHVFEMPAKAVHYVTSRGACETASLDGQLLLLPLCSDLGDMSRLLGCFVTTGTRGKAPHRFTLARSDVRSLSGKPLATAAPPRPDDVPAGFGDPPRGFEGQPEKSRPRGAHLRLVHDRDRADD